MLPSPHRVIARSPGHLPTPVEERLLGTDLDTSSLTSPRVLAISGCHHRVPQTDWTDRNLLLTVPEAGSLKLG